MVGIVDERNCKHTGFVTNDIRKRAGFRKRLIGRRARFSQGGNAVLPRFPCAGLT
jgi:chorismate-pyruvate lyase